MKNYNLATIYFLGKVKDGQRVPDKFKGKATVYHDTVTEYYDLPKEEADDFVKDYESVADMPSGPMKLEGEYPCWELVPEEDLFQAVLEPFLFTGQKQRKEQSCQND